MSWYNKIAISSILYGRIYGFYMSLYDSNRKSLKTILLLAKNYILSPLILTWDFCSWLSNLSWHNSTKTQLLSQLTPNLFHDRIIKTPIAFFHLYWMEDADAGSTIKDRVFRWVIISETNSWLLLPGIIWLVGFSVLVPQTYNAAQQ